MKEHCSSEGHKDDERCAGFYQTDSTIEWQRNKAQEHLDNSNLEPVFKEVLSRDGKLNFMPPICFVEQCNKRAWRTQEIQNQREESCPQCLNFSSVKGLIQDGTKISQENECGAAKRLNDQLTVTDDDRSPGKDKFLTKVAETFQKMTTWQKTLIVGLLAVVGLFLVWGLWRTMQVITKRRTTSVSARRGEVAKSKSTKATPSGKSYKKRITDTKSSFITK